MVINVEDRLQDVYNVYKLYTIGCEDQVRKTRPLSLRVSRIVWKLYDDILTSMDKEVLKAILEGTIIAMAKQRLQELPCSNILEAKLNYAIVRASGSPSVSFNINVNIQKAEANPKVNVSVDLKPIIEIVERLYELRKPLPPTQRRLVEELYNKIKRVN